MKRSEIIILCIVLFFAFLLVYIPHLTNPYPIHVDEWNHISEALKLKNGDYASGWNRFEFGFHFILMILSYFLDLVLFYKYFPAIWVVITSLVLFYVVYKKTDKNYLISIFSVIFFISIKSNVNILGLWFFTPLSFSIPFIFLYVYYFTEGIEKQNKKYLIFSLFIMSFVIFVHAISLLFIVPVFIVYFFFNHRSVFMQWKILLIFLFIPILGILFFSLNLNIHLKDILPKLSEYLQFKHGWGVTEMDNSPFEIYSLIGYLLGIIGLVHLLFLTYVYKIKYKRYVIYLIWPIVLLLSIVYYRLFDVSYLSPYQRNLYYFAIAMPFLSAFGLYFLIESVNKKIDRSYKETEYIKTTIKVAIIILVVSLVFANYLDIPKKTLLYKLIDEGDYDALISLSNKPKAIILTTPAISMAVYPVIGDDTVTGIYFNEKGNKEEVKNFYSNSTNCSDKNDIINKHKPDYIISKYDLNCSWKMIYNKTLGNMSDYIYEIDY